MVLIIILSPKSERKDLSSHRHHRPVEIILRFQKINMLVNRLTLAAALFVSNLANVNANGHHEEGVCSNRDTGGNGAMGPPQLVLSFSKIDYNWDDDHLEQEYLDSDAFMPDVNVITGIKVGPGVATDPRNTNLFLTVPRWFGGVPSTLNRVTVDMTLPDNFFPISDPVLDPWPSWEMQEVGNCDALQYVQSMEIDNDGLMWVIDTGRVDIFTDSPINDCPPKLVILDVETGEMLGEPYIFPTEVAPHDSVFFNDITIDNVNKVAYISDMTGTNEDGAFGALIVFDLESRSSMRFVHRSMYPEIGHEWFFKNESIGRNAFGAAINGVALTPDSSRLFYSALQQSGNTYSIDTISLRKALSDGDPTIDWAAVLINHGPRRSFTDGMTFDCAGNLFHSSLNEGSFYSWDSSSVESPLAAGILAWEDTDETCGTWWTDTYAWDDEVRYFVLFSLFSLFSGITHVPSF